MCSQVLRQKATKDEICVGDGEWSAFAITRRTWMSRGRLDYQLSLRFNKAAADLGANDKHAVAIE
jgi:hypothetical protein